MYSASTILWFLTVYILFGQQTRSQETFAFENGSATNVMITDGGNGELKCNAKGASSITWRRVGNANLEALGIWTENDVRNKSSLFINNAKPEHTGFYICSAFSKFDQTILNKTYQVTVGKPDGSNNGTFIGGISMTIVVVTLLVVWIFFEFFRKPKNGLTKAEIDEFLLGNIEAIQNNGFYAHENAPYMPYSETYEIPDSKLYVDPKDILGSGAFGLVMRGKVNNKIVAVKSLKPGVEKSKLKSLLAELKVMIYLGTHENIVNLVGASTKKLALGSVYIVVDCCDLGSLDKYIRTRQVKFVNQFDSKSRITKRLNSEDMCTKDLVIWCAQIANGMAFMGTKNVIHGDLASRNVLLSDRYTIKITDFGLSRQLYDYTTNYKKQNMEPLPWRWMAYESLRELNFSCKSDIWSYGVTLWEIFTLGEVPYPGLSWTHEFVDGLLENRRLAKPRHSSTEIYHQMLKCWNIDPQKRVSFTNSKEFFNNIIESGD